MTDHKFPVKLNDGRQLPVTANELQHLIDNHAVEIVPNGGFPAVFSALGAMYGDRAEADQISPDLTYVAPNDRNWFTHATTEARNSYQRGRRDAFSGNGPDNIRPVDESDAITAAYVKGYESVPEHRRGETAPRPVKDRPQA